MEASRKKKKKIPRWVKITLSTLLIVLIGAGAYFYHVYNDVAKAVNKMNVPLKAKAAPKINFNNLDPISILMVGVDERKGDSGRTDSIIVITINPKTKTTKLLSIPRDTRTKLINKSNPSKDRFDKINAAYAYGGIQESIDTVENFLNVPIDYYIKVNMEGFKDIVNAVGGINVDNKYAFELDGVTLKTGPQHLNGLQALEYARMRHQDPKGDFGRQERQREVISKIIQKGKSVSILTKYNSILKALENNIQTDLTMDDIIGIQSSYKPAAKNMEQLQVEGTGATINKIWYYQVDDQERQTLSDQMRDSLGLSSSPVAKMYDDAQVVDQSEKQTTKSSAASNTSTHTTTSTSSKSTVKYQSNPSSTVNSPHNVSSSSSSNTSAATSSNSTSKSSGTSSTGSSSTTSPAASTGGTATTSPAANTGGSATTSEPGTATNTNNSAGTTQQ